MKEGNIQILWMEKRYNYSNIQTKIQISVFENLKKKPYVAFRYGELSYDGWKLRNNDKFREKMARGENISGKDLQIKVTQKGVDLKIGLDIAWIAMKNIVDKILIITGDSDLIPAMKFARKEGLTVCLETLGEGVKRGMIEHSDLVFRTKTRRTKKTKSRDNESGEKDVKPISPDL